MVVSGCSGLRSVLFSCVDMVVCLWWVSVIIRFSMVELVMLVMLVLKVRFRFCIGVFSVLCSVVRLVVWLRVLVVLFSVMMRLMKVFSMFSSISRLVSVGVRVRLGRVMCRLFRCCCMLVCSEVGSVLV